MTSPSAARVEWLTVAGDAAAWRDVGLNVDAAGTIPLFGTSLRLVPGAPDGLLGWALSGVDAAPATIDGLATEVVQPLPPMFSDHPLGAIGLDHVVVLSADLDRTSDAITAATGCELRRVREVGTMRQGFHRMGSGGLIVEIVERPDVPAGPASFWGIVLDVEDLDAAVDLLGPERVGAAKDAVQPGRRIATLREGAGLGLPVALMTPDVR
jgi:hypothetical protein